LTHSGSQIHGPASNRSFISQELFVTLMKPGRV
jgi:hypothetical protein